MSCTKHVSQKHCWCWGTQCKGSESIPPGSSEKRWETRCRLTMKTSSIRFCWDVPGGLHGNRRQLKPSCVFAEQGRAQRWWHRRCPSLGLRVPVPVCAPRPLPAPRQGSVFAFVRVRAGGCPLGTRRTHLGDSAGPRPGLRSGPRPGVGPGRPARPLKPWRRGTGHPLPGPTVTYGGGGCRRERCRPRGRTPARLRQGCRPGGGRPPVRCRKGEYLPETRAFIPLGRSAGGSGRGQGCDGWHAVPGEGGEERGPMCPLAAPLSDPLPGGCRRESPPAAAASASPRRWQPDEPRRGAAAVLGWTRRGCQRQPSARKARAEAVPARRRATPLRRGWRRRGGGRERGGAAPRRPGRKGKRGTGKVRRGHGHAKGTVRGGGAAPRAARPRGCGCGGPGRGEEAEGGVGGESPSAPGTGQVASDSGDARRCERQTPPGPCPVKKRKRQHPLPRGAKIRLLLGERCLVAQQPYLPSPGRGERQEIGAAAGSCWRCLESRKQGHGRCRAPTAVSRGGVTRGGGSWAYPQPLPLLPAVIFSFSSFLCCPPTPSPTAGVTESLRTRQVAHAKARRVWTPGGHLLPSAPAPGVPSAALSAGLSTSPGHRTGLRRGRWGARYPRGAALGGRMRRGRARHQGDESREKGF